MGLFSRRKHQLVPKASCDDPKPSPSFCLPIVATPTSSCGCALPLRLSICCQRLRKENQSHQHDSKKYTNFIYNPKKNPRKNCSKNWAWQGIAMPTVVMVTD